MTPGSALLMVNAASTFGLAGLIWTIQLVHYPAFRYVAEQQFAAFASFHQRQISWVVVPLMVVELASAAGLMALTPPELPQGLVTACAFLVVLIWACTFLVQVPLHRRLASGYDRGAIEALIRTNWIRTLLWSLRAGLLFWALYVSVPALERAA